MQAAQVPATCTHFHKIIFLWVLNESSSGLFVFLSFFLLLLMSHSPVPLTHQQTPNCSLLDFQVCGFHEILRGLSCASANVMQLLGEDIQETGLFVFVFCFYEREFKKATSLKPCENEVI